jgi:hypothetical protein
VCDKWINDFEQFVLDMGPRPAGHSIDRINNDGNYTPENTRWATRQEQGANKRICKKDIPGYISYSEFAREVGLSKGTVVHQMKTGRCAWPQKRFTKKELL